MLNTKVLIDAPKCLIFKKNNKSLSDINLIVHGQGVFLFDTDKETSFTYYTKDKSDGLRVFLTKRSF